MYQVNLTIYAVKPSYPFLFYGTTPGLPIVIPPGEGTDFSIGVTAPQSAGATYALNLTLTSLILG